MDIFNIWVTFVNIWVLEVQPQLTGIRQVVPPWTKLEQKNNMGDTGISSKDFSACRLLFSVSDGGNWPYASPLWCLLLKTGIEWLVEEKNHTGGVYHYWSNAVVSFCACMNRLLVLKRCHFCLFFGTFSGRVRDCQSMPYAIVKIQFSLQPITRFRFWAAKIKEGKRRVSFHQRNPKTKVYRLRNPC